MVLKHCLKVSAVWKEETLELGGANLEGQEDRPSLD